MTTGYSSRMNSLEIHQSIIYNWSVTMVTERGNVRNTFYCATETIDFINFTHAH